MSRDWAGQGRRGDDHADRRSPAPARPKTAPRGCRSSRRKAILDLRLARLTALGRDEIGEELDKLAVEIADYLDILRSRARVQTIIKDELAAVKSEFATPRKTDIVEQRRRGRGRGPDPARGHGGDGVACRLRQARAAVGLSGAAPRRQGPFRHATRDEDFVSRLFVASTHTPVLFFSSRGQVYKEKVWRLPVAAPNGARQGADQHPAAGAGRAHHHHHAAAGG